MYRYSKAIAAMAISAATFPAPGLCAYADNDYLAGTSPEGEMETTTSNTVTVDYVGNFVYENGTLTRILFEGGYVDMTGAAPEYMFYLTDHLGNVRVVADSEGNIAQVNHYYPYGDRFSDGRYALPSSSTRDNDHLFGGKELDSSSGLHDFEARYDNTRFGRFTTMDPMAEKHYGISPYAYCAGNPINRVDPNGQADYFKQDGSFWGSDNVDDGLIRILAINSFDNNLNEEYGFNESYFLENSYGFYDAIHYNILSEDNALKIYEHYNETGLPLMKTSENRDMGFFSNSDEPYILINVNNTSKMMDNYYNLSNRLNHHEGGHYNQWISKGSKACIIPYNIQPIEELFAIVNQMTDDSWRMTTTGFKDDAINYMLKNLLLIFNPYE